MIDEVAKAHLHDHLRWVREVLVWKLDGLSEYDIRRPFTTTGTNLLGLVKHSAITNARYFGEVFDRPFPEPIPDGTTAQLGMRPSGRRNTRLGPTWSTSVGAYGVIRTPRLKRLIWMLAATSRGGRKRCRCSTSWFIACPRPIGTRDMPTSCGKDSTAQWAMQVARLCTDATILSGRLSARSSSVPPKLRIRIGQGDPSAGPNARS
jgi:Protein of unknown function (DUF664)